MSNIKKRDTSTVPQSEVTIPKIHQPEYKHNLINLEQTPPNSVIANYAGYPMIVTLYNQVIGVSQEQDGFNAGQTTPHQSYRRITNLKIKLQSPFDYSMNPSTAMTNVSSSARVYAPGLILMEGDVFLADIGAGRLGRFEVRSAPRLLSWFDRAVIEFEFVMLELATIDVVNELDAKVVQKLNFVEDFILSGQNPLLTDDELTAYHDLSRLHVELSNLWLRECYSYEHQTLLVPNQPSTTYDPYVVNFACSLMTNELSPLVGKIRNLNVDGRQTRDYMDIYTVILDCNLSGLSHCFKKAKAAPTTMWTDNYSAASIRFSGIDKCVYPIQPNQGVDAYYDSSSSGYSTGQSIVNSSVGTHTIDNMSIFQPMGTVDAYVFSEGFYAQSGGYETILEDMVGRYLNGEPLDQTLLLKVANSVKNWSAVDNFYYGPIVVALIKASIGKI